MDKQTIVKVHCSRADLGELIEQVVKSNTAAGEQVMITNEYMERLRVDAEGLSHPMNQHLYNTATASLADIAADDFSIPRSVRAVLCHAMIAGHLAHTATQPGFSWLLEQAEIQIRAATAAFNDVEEDNESIAEMFSVVLAAAIKSAEEEVANSMELLKEGEK